MVWLATIAAQVKTPFSGMVKGNIMATALIILAAGRGTRMNSDMPKVLHRVGGRALFAHAVAAGQALGAERSVLVVGHGAEAVTAAAHEFDPSLEIVVQTEQLGTGDAVRAAQQALGDFDGDVVVLLGDTPFISAQTLENVAKARATNDVVVVGFHAADPALYGRLVMQGARLERIVEYKDATEAERAIAFCNSGITAASAGVMFDLVGQLDDDNASNELYLTDIVGLANTNGLRATAVTCDEAETLGINSREDLAQAEAIFQARARQQALENGVTLVAPDTVYFCADTHVGRDVVIEPNVVFGPDATVETGAHIRAFSHIEGAHIGAGSVVGPFARLRPGAELANDSHIGNFVEIKNAVIGEGSKVNHLSYIGDADVGRRSNIGAGTITCNYDGVMKHRTRIGDDVFIGSDTMLVAPVSIGDRAMTATGTVVSSDVPDGAMAIGRSRQENKPGFAVKLFEKLRAAKAARQKG